MLRSVCFRRSVLGGVCAQLSDSTEMASPDEDVAGDLPDNGPLPPPAAARLKRPREHTQFGELRLFVALASSSGLWADAFLDEAPTCGVSARESKVVGLALARWAWFLWRGTGGDVARETFVSRLNKSSQARRIFGYIDYVPNRNGGEGVELHLHGHHNAGRRRDLASDRRCSG